MNSGNNLNEILGGNSWIFYICNSEENKWRTATKPDGHLQTELVNLCRSNTVNANLDTPGRNSKEIQKTGRWMKLEGQIKTSLTSETTKKRETYWNPTGRKYPKKTITDMSESTRGNKSKYIFDERKILKIPGQDQKIKQNGIF